MTDFAAIDFETANKERSSVCSVGIVIVRNGEITEKLYRLIRPYPNYYSYWNKQVHGLTFQDTACAPTFPEVWKEIDPIIAGLPLVAHNSPFDEGCLKAAFQVQQARLFPFISRLRRRGTRGRRPRRGGHSGSLSSNHITCRSSSDASSAFCR